ncbi:hypothetical protein HanRHA438_Chr09g0412111 [Helianthus annuus]|nr:hypothetical protein HanHA300_Chr09g0328541 [Helianthus annuus]KAJ0535489.1 hypothetical protein HanIR_Chr09g0431191 [Helianthus annuus]KAJ0543322.1 hypothetical protein HanHA89_Chr09g0349451 [Helianthus annuus]KAJ0708380.1 hypothetical protein HanLR1_Chr09g0328801 [Helianthus annuus]KAJ0889367.1 hypothetical protein HanRHA438_Chr09g0412111 [Helianthus annuus]
MCLYMAILVALISNAVFLISTNFDNIYLVVKIIRNYLVTCNNFKLFGEFFSNNDDYSLILFKVNSKECLF